MKCLFTAMLIFGFTIGYSQCTGIVKLVNPKKQRTNFYSPRYDAPTRAPVRYVRVDQDGSTQIYLTITVLGDSARFNPTEVDSLSLGIEAAFVRLAQRDSLKRVVSPKSIQARPDRIDSIATAIDSVMTKFDMSTSLRDSLVRVALKKSRGPVPMAYRGRSLTFSDGTKLAWPSRLVSFKVVEGAGTWSSFIPLTEAQLRQLATGLISEVSVYKYDQSLTKEQAEQARQFVNCIRDAR